MARVERIRKQNYWFDALYNSCVAGYACGVRLVDEVVPEAPQRVQPERPAGIWPLTDEAMRDRWNANPTAYRAMVSVVPSSCNDVCFTIHPHFVHKPPES